MMREMLTLDSLKAHVRLTGLCDERLNCFNCGPPTVLFYNFSGLPTALFRPPALHWRYILLRAR